MDKQELIRKFLNNECDASEAALVDQYLAAEPDLLHSSLLREEWDETGKYEFGGGAGLKQEIWREVESATRKNPVHRRLYSAIAVAASILILVAAGNYLRNYYASVPGTSGTAAAPASLVAQNPTDGISTFTLPDGSEVTLYPNTTIRYSADFANNRTIHLTAGKAAFDVAHDPRHPFTVYSGNISTTALGTRFLVDHSRRNINVQLYEGKVLVKYLSKNAQVLPAILSPGEQCFVNLNIDGIAIAPVKTGHPTETALQRPPAAAPGKAAMLTFNNVALSDAFEILGGVFHERITYNPREVEKMYFTGQFGANDSLAGILRIFTSVNGLAVEKGSGGIHIVKEKPVRPQIKAAGVPEEDTHVAKAGAVQYSNTPLETLFREMETTFGVRIRYNPQDIAHKYFTGTISGSDDAGTILAVICRLNQLQAVQVKEGFNIIKNK